MQWKKEKLREANQKHVGSRSDHSITSSARNYTALKKIRTKKYNEAFTHQLKLKRKTIMKISSIIVTAVFAGAAGVIAGTLFAPGKGSKTRNKIARKGQEYKDYLQDNFDDFADVVSHPFEDIEDKTIRLSEKAIDKVKKIKAEVNQK